MPIHHFGRNIGIVVVIILLIVIALAVVPIPHTVPYKFSISNPGSLSTYYRNQTLCPAGASVSVTFVVNSGDTVTFSVVNPNGGTVWSDDASLGGTSFTVQTCGTYSFGAYDWGPATVVVSLSVFSTSPIL